MHKPPMRNSTKLVVFDLFGTLVKYGVMRHPFRELLKWARDGGRRPKPDDARILMTVNRKLPDLIKTLGISAPEWLLEQTQQHILDEIESASLFNDVEPTLAALQERGIPFAICSNLAAPYGSAVKRLLNNHKFIRCMSYEVGFIKPEPEMYKTITDAAQVEPGDCLFVGDTYLADYEGPQKCGIRALHLVRGQPGGGATIASLNDALSHID